MAECLYCQSTIPDLPGDWQQPEPEDEAAWKTLAEDHTADCRWIETKGLRVGLTDKERLEWRIPETV